MALTEGDVIHVDKFEDLRAKFAIWVHLRTFEIKTEYFLELRTHCFHNTWCCEDDAFSA